MIQKRSYAILITVLILLAMSLSTILTKMVFVEITPGVFAYITMTIAVIVLPVYTFLIKKERIPTELMTKNVWLYLVQIGFFNFVLGTISIYALNLMPVTTNTYIGNFIGFLTMGMSIIILKEKPSLFQVLGAVIAFAGLRVFFPEPPQGGELLGIFLVLISITGVAYTNNIARKLALETENKISNNIVSTLALLIGGPVAIVIFVAIEGFPAKMPSLAAWGVILYSALISKAIGLTVWNLILRTLRSYEASILGASSVIWTSLLAVMILGEELAVYQIVGICMMFIGLVLVQVRSGSIGKLFRKQEVE